MRLRIQLVAAVLLLVVALSCSPNAPESSAAGTWVGTITTEGNVTTVVNESGSVWGGTATLVEEASIGVESGEDAYMLGSVASVMATDAEIFVADRQVPAVRVYDMQGRHLRDLGAAGQGPGEFTFPGFMAAMPGGRVLLLDPRANRVNVYGPAPEDIDSWPLRNVACCVFPMQLDRSGALWIEMRIFNEETRSSRRGMLAHGPEGPIGEPFVVPEYDYRRWTYTVNGREYDLPMTPLVHWNIHPAGALVAGVSDRYRFEILFPSGRRTVVEKYWNPVPFTQEEAAFWRRVTQNQIAQMSGGSGTERSWDGRLPETKPAFTRFQIAATGEIWVAREKPAEIVPDCEPDPSADPNDFDSSQAGFRPAGTCFVISYTVDVFGADGRYLGALDVPRLHPYSFIRGDTFLTPTENEAGTIMVKRYRLVLPGEEKQ